MAQTTKHALAASLKKIMMKTSLDKITVTDITNDCEVNRKTFYYHFQDIYDLIEWMFEYEGMKVIDGKETYDTWQQGYLQILEYVLENREFIFRTYNSISREQLEKYLYREVYGLLLDVVKEKAVGIHMREADLEFIANFYKYAFVGYTLEWIGNGMKEKPEVVVERLSSLIYGDIERAIEKLSI